MPVGIAGIGGKMIYDPTPDPPTRVPDEPDESDEPPADAPADTDEPDDSDSDSDRTLDELRTGSGGKTVDRKPIFGTDDISVRPGEWPIGFPLQGIPRVAVTVNLNYVYDESRGEWTRQNPFEGGGGLEVVVTETVTVPPNGGNANILTGLSPTDLNTEQLLPVVVYADKQASQTQDLSYTNLSQQSAGVPFELFYRDTTDEIELVIRNYESTDITVRGTVYRIDA